jgi:hypothetical protein
MTIKTVVVYDINPTYDPTNNDEYYRDPAISKLLKDKLQQCDSDGQLLNFSFPEHFFENGDPCQIWPPTWTPPDPAPITITHREWATEAVAQEFVDFLKEIMPTNIVSATVVVE